jgi:hypothetical protein
MSRYNNNTCNVLEHIRGKSRCENDQTGIESIVKYRMEGSENLDMTLLLNLYEISLAKIYPWYFY